MVQTEKMREEFARRLAQACKNYGLDEHGKGIALAKALGVSSKATSKWFNAESLPRPAMVQAIAKFLKVDLVWLQMGIASIKDESNVSYLGKLEAKNSFPLISWVNAGCWLEALEPYTADDIDDWPTTTVNASDNSFWLRVKGDSMTAPSGFSVPEGMIILVDPDKEPVSGNLVIAKLTDDNEATFKKLVIDSGQKFLQALNPKWPLIGINGDCKIIGVVVDAKWEKMP